MQISSHSKGDVYAKLQIVPLKHNDNINIRHFQIIIQTYTLYRTVYKFEEEGNSSLNLFLKIQILLKNSMTKKKTQMRFLPIYLLIHCTAFQLSHMTTLIH